MPETKGHGLLAGRVVLVTAAAGTGIGFATAKRCAEEGATVVISVVSLLVYAPLHALVFGFQSMAAVGWRENALQVIAQGILSGPLATYLSAYAASVLGTGRGATFSALVPGFTMLIGVVALREMPTLIQLAGLAVVAIGFRLVMRR